MVLVLRRHPCPDATPGMTVSVRFGPYLNEGHDVQAVRGALALGVPGPDRGGVERVRLQMTERERTSAGREHGRRIGARAVDRDTVPSDRRTTVLARRRLPAQRNRRLGARDRHFGALAR